MPLRVSNGWPFIVDDPQPAARTGIEVRVYDGQNPATLIDIVARSRDRTWLDHRSDIGRGEFMVHASDEVLERHPTLLQSGNIVRFRLDGIDRFAFVITRRERVRVSAGEHAGAWIKVSGPGVLALLHTALLYRIGNTLDGGITRGTDNQNAGNFLSIMFDQAQDRGCLGGVTRSFDADVDSNNHPWADIFAYHERAGTTLLTTAKRLAELAVDIGMSPQLVFNVWNSQGVDRSFQTADEAPIILREAHNINALEVAADGDIVNTLLIEGADEALWAERQNATSITTYGRREGFLSLTNEDSDTYITQAADATLDHHASDAEHLTLEILDVDDHRPYANFGLGDWVLAPNEAGQLARVRIGSITVSEDAHGNPKFTVEVGTVLAEIEERFMRWLRRVGDGTLGGTAAGISSI